MRMTHSSKTPIPINLCILFLLMQLWACAQPQLTSPLQIIDQLQCTLPYVKYAFPIIDASHFLVFKLNVTTTNGLPVVMSLFQSQEQIANFNVNSLAAYEIDSQALDKNKIQSLQYQPALNLSVLYIAIFRIPLQQFRFASNIDRPIQNYNTFALSQLNTCTQSIDFTLSISRSLHYTQKLPGISLPPLFPTDCSHGSFEGVGQSCDCQTGFGMSLCDIQFIPILSLNSPHSSYLSPNSKQVYYFQATPAVTNNSLSLQVAVKGVASGPYSFASVKSNSFSVLMLIQSIDDSLSLPTMFNQMNPLAIDGLTLKANQRLVITVYKPVWSDAQPYQITIAQNNNSLQQLIIIIIAICCGITFLAIFAFVLYLIHYRRRFTDDQTVALPLRRANSKVSNEFFVTDKHFPTLTFAELTAAILQAEQELFPTTGQQLSTSGWDEQNNSTCAICLESFNAESQVKLAYCGHIFNSKCLRQWINRQPSCPLCRFQFSAAAIRSIETKLALATVKPVEKCVKVWRWVKAQSKDKQDKQATPAQANDPQSSYQLNNLNSQHNLT